MALPTPDAYNDAIQTPRLAFSDPVLAAGTVDCNGLGIPRGWVVGSPSRIGSPTVAAERLPSDVFTRKSMIYETVINRSTTS